MVKKYSFLEDLRNPIKSFRLEALELAIESSPRPEILGALQSAREHETDPECLLLYPHAISRHSPPDIPTAPRRVPVEHDSKRFIAEFSALTATEKIRRLNELSEPQCLDLAQWAPTAFRGESDPLVAAALLHRFTAAWPTNHLSMLGEALFQGFLTVRQAALKALIIRAPEALAKDLPQLLTSAEPRTRMLAIRGLAAVDPAEAINHLEALLLGGDPSMKRAMLKGCSVLPFRLVKKSLLKFLVLETSPLLLEQAGIPFQINPDIETPLSLLELVETSSPPKSHIIRETLQIALQTLRESGILGTRFAEFQARVQEIIQRRLATRYIREMLQWLETEDPTLLQEAESSLRRNLGRFVIRDTLEKALEWPLSPKARERVYLLIDGKPFIVGENEVPVQFSFDLPPATQCRWFANLQEEDAPQAGSIIDSVLNAPDTPVPVRIAALRSAGRLQMKSQISAAERRLKDPDEGLAVAALDYLSATAPDLVFPLLGGFFSGASLKLKVAAMKVFARYDPVQALTTLVSRLESSSPTEPAVSVAALVYFDFVVIRDPLTEILCTRWHDELFTMAMFLFQGNPDRDNLYALYKIEQHLVPAKREVLNRVRAENINVLKQLGQATEEDLNLFLGTFPERWKAEQARRQAPPPYALQSLKSGSPGTFSSEGGGFSEFEPSTKAFLVGAGILAALALLHQGYALVVPHQSPGPHRTDSGLSMRPQAFSGILIKQQETEIIIKSESGDEIHLSPPKEGFPRLTVGQPLQGSFVPMGGSNGLIKGKCKLLAPGSL